MRAESTVPTLARILPPQPYPGLRSFTSDEWMIFFGREEVVDNIISRLATQNMVFLHGASGAGKSSLVRAGILPRLARLYGRTEQPWLTCEMRPSTGPLWGLAAALARLADQAEDLVFIGEIAARLTEPGATLSSVAATLPGLRDRRICLLVDQFEELFRYEREVSRDIATLFVELLLGEAPQEADEVSPHAAPSRGQVHILITMRSEFLGECTRFDGLTELINRAQYLVPRLSRAELLRAICTPAELFGGKVSVALAERLIENMRGKSDELPLLQHALMLFWIRTSELKGPRPELGDDLLDQEGGVAAVVAAHAEQVLKNAAPDERARRLVARSFRALASLGPDGRITRHPRSWPRLVELAGATEEELRAVLDPFRVEGVCFLSPYGEGPLTPYSVIDLSHEALTRVWPLLQGWIVDETAAVKRFRQLEMLASQWQADPASVPSRAAINEYDAWWQREAPTPAWVQAQSSLPRADEAQALILSFIAASKANWAQDARAKAWRRWIAATVGIIALTVSLAAIYVAFIFPRQADSWGDDAFYGVHGSAVSNPSAWMWYNISNGISQNAHAEDMIGLMYMYGDGVQTNYGQAMRYFQQATTRGSSDAANNIGLLYGNGDGVKKDDREARKWYLRGAQEGSAWAANNLGNYAYNGLGDLKHDDATALYWYQQSLRLDTDQPMYQQLRGQVLENIGYLYEYPNDSKADAQKAMSWFMKADACGNGEADNQIGFIYQYGGNGIPKNPMEAMVWYQKAQGRGDFSAEDNIGSLYEQGLGVKRDYNKALYWYKRAGNDGVAAGADNAANMFFNGSEVTQDYGQALYWYEKADAMGDDDADNTLGVMYQYGDGVVADAQQAMTWYQKAAAANNAQAMYSIGVLYDSGIGVALDYRAAMRWYLKAAALGNAEATNNIGALYFRGHGVKQDYKQAIQWFIRAQKEGLANAADNLGTVYDNGDGVNVDLKQAIAWYTIGAQGGVANSETQLAIHYLTGQGLPRDNAAAVAWIEKADDDDDLGDAESQIGTYYRLGANIKQDYLAARYWFVRGVADGSGWSAVSLGFMDAQGQGAPANHRHAMADFKKGLALYQKSSDRYPDDLQLVAAVNFCRILTGQAQRAEGALSQTFSLSPGNIWLEVLEAMAWMVDGQPNKARQIYLVYEGLQDDGLGISWQNSVSTNFTLLRDLGYKFPLMDEVLADFATYNATQAEKTVQVPKNQAIPAKPSNSKNVSHGPNASAN